jgi:hypothetical protein
MASWADFERAEPALAEAVRATFAVRKHATMATIRRDGSPRISGTEVDFRDDGHVYLGMMVGARRAGDLRRDPRMALHSPTVDTPEDDPTTWLGEGKIDAVASEVDDHLFRLDIHRVVLTRVVNGGLEVSTWLPGRGLGVVRR